jgi:hypothetical protein
MAQDITTSFADETQSPPRPLRMIASDFVLSPYTQDAWVRVIFGASFTLSCPRKDFDKLMEKLNKFHQSLE